MATVTSTLSMFDAMSRPLQNVTSAMNTLISTMEDMQNTADRNVNIDNSLVSAKNQIADAEADIRRGIEQSTNEQQNFNREVQTAKHDFASIASQVGGILATYLSFRTAKNVFSDLVRTGFEFNAHMESSTIAFTTMLGSAEQAQSFLNDLYEFNLTTPFDFADWVTGSRNLIAFGMEAQNVIPTLEAVGNAVGGMGGGSAEIMQLIDAFGAIQVRGRLTAQELERFTTAGIPALQILANQYDVTADAMRNMISDGAVSANEAISLLVDGIQNGTEGLAGMTSAYEGLMDELQGTFTGSMGSLSAAWRNAGSDFTDYFYEPIVNAILNIRDVINETSAHLAPIGEAIGRVMEAINEAFETGRVQEEIDSMVRMLQIFADITARAAIIAIENIDIIRNILIGLGAVIAGVTVLWIAKWVAAAWPIFAIAGGIALLITILNQFGVTVEDIIGHAIGTFYMLFAYINNSITLVWNRFISLAEFVANIFIDPVYAIKKQFYDLVMQFLEFMLNMSTGAGDFANNFVNAIVGAINRALSGFNWLVDRVNSIFNTDFSRAELFDTSNINTASDLIHGIMDRIEKPTSDKDVVDFSHLYREYEDLGEAFERGYNVGGGIISRMESLGNQISSDMLNQSGMFSFDDLGLGDIGSPDIGGIGNIGKVDKVGELDRINDEVDISSEDLRLLREYAEQQNIQNFVTLTPNISVTTGDIRETVDADTIISTITTRLEEEINSSARGVYS